MRMNTLGRRSLGGQKQRGIKTFFVLMILTVVLRVGIATADLLAKGIALSIPASDDLAEQVAVAIAEELFLQQRDVIQPDSASTFDFPKLEVENREFTTHSTFVTLKKQNSETTSAWVVSFFVKDLNAFAGYAAVESPSGEIIDTGFDYLLQITARWEKEKGARFFWSLDDKYVFQQLFTMPSSGLRLTLPDANDLSEEEAGSIAISAVAKRYGVSESRLHQDYQMDYNLELQRNGDSFDRTWRVIFRHYDKDSQGYPQAYCVQILSTDGSVLLIEESGSGLG